MSPVRWGIIGAGGIAQKFARDLSVAGGGAIRAVVSRDMARARSAASALGAPLAFGDVSALAEERSVDIAYIATPHQAHFEAARDLLLAGKPVLVEKPMAVNAAQVRELIEIARCNRVLLVEALWTRFLPLYRRVRRLLDDGRIGRVRAVTSCFCFRGDLDPTKRWMNPHLAGGALLDLGVYCLAAAQFALRAEPSEIAAVAKFSTTGVDELLSASLAYEGGAMASFTCGLVADGDNRLVIAGEQGRVEVPPHFIAAQKAFMRTSRGEKTIEEPFSGEGFEFEIAEAHRCLRAGEIESPLMPLDDSLGLAVTMDRIRVQIGLKYPFE